MTKLMNWWSISPAILLFAATAASAQTFTTLLTFSGHNGALPDSPLTQGVDGAFYGATQYGGTSSCQRQSCGTVFRFDGGTRLESVNLPNVGSSGPAAGLVLDTDGTFYGSTAGAGAYGYGSVFGVTSAGVFTTLHSFCADGFPPCSDGRLPVAPLVEGADGNLYGTTEGGGGGSACPFEGDCGTVFVMTPSGQFSKLYAFCSQPNCIDGSVPTAGLVQGFDGDFYGTTTTGGNGPLCEGATCGTVFKITPKGLLTVLHNFAGMDGNKPNAGLTLAPDGTFYGTTAYGGVYGEGTVFKITPTGTLSSLYSFCAAGPPCGDGAQPIGALLLATDGNLYGTTAEGGNIDVGTLFQITTKGMLTTLHSFDNNDGANTQDGLLQATSGIIYGTALRGGDLDCSAPYGCGTIFALDMGLGPFVTFVRGTGRVGQTGGILGQGFTGTTSVAINGIQANFTVVSDTFIRATVPSGATTGYVTVTTPSGKLTSNVPFHVIQ